MRGVHFRADGYYLALDTSGSVGSVAVGRGGEVLASVRMEEKGRHASHALVSVNSVLEEAGLELADVAGVLVGEGPGSFTGVRVAAATAKGLARALNVPLWAVSSLAAAAAGDLGQSGAGVRYVLFDARADRVYGGCYGVGSRGIETLVPPNAGDLRSILGERIPDAAAFAGDGAHRHRRALQDAGFTVLDAPIGEPTGAALLHILGLHPDMPPVADMPTWEPRYLKASNAEREWPA